MCFGEGKIEKTFSICQKTCFHDYGSALNNDGKLDRNIVLSHSDSIDKFIMDLLTWQFMEIGKEMEVYNGFTYSPGNVVYNYWIKIAW